MSHTPMTAGIFIMVIAMAAVLITALVFIFQNHSVFSGVRAWWARLKAEQQWCNAFADELFMLCQQSGPAPHAWEVESLAVRAFMERCEHLPSPRQWPVPGLVAYGYWQRRLTNAAR